MADTAADKEKNKDQEDDLSLHFSVGEVSELSIVTTTNNTMNEGSIAMTLPGDLDMQPLPVPVDATGENRRSALEPLAAADPSPSSSRKRNGSNISFTGTTVIDEQHSNYVLMYDMLTGIRITVPQSFIFIFITNNL